MNDVRDLKNGAICAAWIAGIFLAGWLLWFFTGNLRDQGLMRQANRVLAARGENFQLTGIRPPRKRRIPLGTEFVMESWIAVDPAAADTALEEIFLVFPLVSGGASFSCGAVINTHGRVERYIPLGFHGEQVFERLAPGILDVYTRRIEEEGSLE
jgi:hypothetical protein